MKIIDAHMHYYDIDKFYDVAGSRYAGITVLFLPWRWATRKMLPAVMAAVRRV